MKPKQQEIVDADEITQLFFSSKSVDEFPDRVDTVMGDPQSDIGIVFQHGFIGSPLELLYIANSLADKYRIVLPLLPGHGNHAREMHGINYQQWIDKTEEAIEFLKNEKEGRTIILMGHSLGGAISIILAAKRDDISAIIPLAAPVKFGFLKRNMIKILSLLFGNKFIEYSEFLFHDTRLLENPLIKDLEKNFAKVSISTLNEVIKLVDKAGSLLNEIKIPIFILHSKYDETVPVSNAYHIYEKVNLDNKRIKIYDKSYHIIVADTDKEQVVHDIKDFLITI